MTAERNAADILIDMEDRLRTAGRLMQALALIGQGLANPRERGAIIELARLAEDMLDQVEEHREQALALLGPSTVAGAEYAQARAEATRRD